MKIISGGVTAPKGFKANGLYCGIKKSKNNDLALIYSEVPCAAAGVFTANKVHASCVEINQEHLKDGKAQAIIANSGNANCMTGKSGFENSRRMASVAARALGLKDSDVCVASTGVIGHSLPIEKISDAVPALAKGLSSGGSKNAARGIMTTDTTMKEVAVEFMIGTSRVRMGAIAKGAGMIHPQMELSKHATMLCFVTTDAAIAPKALRESLDAATQKSFNMITIDGDMSTNDMVLVLGNGKAQNKTIAPNSKEAGVFAEALESILLRLAQMMVRDAEGATKFVTVRVNNAKSSEDARIAARAVASSTLVKCALFGSDPNWGRIAAAVGHSGASVDPWKIKIFLGKFLVSKDGGAVVNKPGVLDRELKKKDIAITLDLGLGSHSATAYTCDLSTNYVKLNSAYHT
ncbi:MAG: bifunctional glutamate N-acetyltransferase/amino-acid acetyltransferase ArgJ [bacterium]|nr:bifunctional glutamate N-acetyltransferase/amino-acid acetyltransferase ArgJ [bacterium]